MNYLKSGINVRFCSDFLLDIFSQHLTVLKFYNHNKRKHAIFSLELLFNYYVPVFSS